MTQDYQAAHGQCVLAAGEIGIDGARVEYLDNHSGGYVPAGSSFHWVQKALTEVGLELELKEFSSLWPSHGYFSLDWLEGHSLP